MSFFTGKSLYFVKSRHIERMKKEIWRKWNSSVSQVPAAFVSYLEMLSVLQTDKTSFIINFFLFVPAKLSHVNEAVLN